jgi:hypothetical protein
MSGWELDCQVRDDEIIVTLPATSYAVTYYKPDNSPRLLARNFPKENDRRSSMSQSEFLARAWKLANDKARELGWIV